ncbi:MAG: ferredoxin [Candidatus Staskawiczbacteria bacterium]|nr:ferredoxin [Candidatus Staskawiczbacteria bacterium]
MAKIILEKDKCISCGSCWAICEEYFEMGDDGRSHIKNVNKAELEELETDDLKCAEAAVEACPVQCIIIKK